MNGNPVAESIAEVDEWIGQVIAEIDKLGIADNTIVMVMGDNGPFMQYVSSSGQADRIYRGGKAQHLEGGVRVNAFIRWPGVLKPGSWFEDMVHVTDLFTTFARIAGAAQQIPRDRLIDGVDQTALLTMGETHGRRDYVFVYEGPNLRSTVKQQYKIHWPAPGENPIGAAIYNLYHDPRESRPKDGIQYGVWAATAFVDMLKRHLGMKMKFPDRKSGKDYPYGGGENLRPETQALLKVYKSWHPDPKKMKK